MKSFIHYGKASISQKDIERVNKTLTSGWLTTGPQVSQFEKAVAKFCQSRFGVAVANATAALHLSCLALGVSEKDFVWTSPNSFLASANCALYCGAKIDFVDICPKTYNMSVEKLSKKLEIAKKQNKLPKVVIPVHFSGQSCSMKEIKDLSKKYNFSIIEDASHAIGAKYQDNPVGSCQYSDLVVFSFHPVKIITSGEGGMVLTNNPNIEKKIKELRNHGMVREKNKLSVANPEPWLYEQQSLGFNYRLTDIQCALGLSQLEQLESFVSKRNYLANRYTELLTDLPIVLPQTSESNYSSFHLYVIQIDSKKTKTSRLEAFNYLTKNNIGVNVHYIPIHTQPYYQEKFGFKWGDFPVAEAYYKQAITLPLFPGLKEEEQDFIIENLMEILR